jgi:hypothetical protein
MLYLTDWRNLKNVFSTFFKKVNMKASIRGNSELNPPENITPSIGTTINAILILLPLSLFLLGLFTGFIRI